MRDHFVAVREGRERKRKEGRGQKGWAETLPSKFLGTVFALTEASDFSVRCCTVIVAALCIEQCGVWRKRLRKIMYRYS